VIEPLPWPLLKLKVFCRGMKAPLMEVDSAPCRFASNARMLELSDGWEWDLMRSRVELARPVRLCLALSIAAVVASLVTRWSANSVRKLDSASAEMVEPPFTLNDPASRDREQPFDANLFLLPLPSFQLPFIPSEFLHSIPAEQVLEYSGPATDNLPLVRPTPDATRSSRVEHDRDSLFNDAQLASIEARLKLNANQRELWRPVETALRAIHWSHDRSHKERSLDLGSEELKRLKTAAMPLITTLREDQKEEIRTLTKLMGLEQLASQF